MNAPVKPIRINFTPTPATYEEQIRALREAFPEETRKKHRPKLEFVKNLGLFMSGVIFALATTSVYIQKLKTEVAVWQGATQRVIYQSTAAMAVSSQALDACTLDPKHMKNAPIPAAPIGGKGSGD